MNTHAVLHAVFTWFFVASLAGCASPPRAYDHAAFARGIQREPTLQLDRLIVDYHAADRERQGPIRDRVIQVGVMLIDADFAASVDELSRFHSSMNTAADLGTLAASTAATLVTPAATKSALAALAGSITATRLSIDRNVLYERSVPVLVQQMRAEREYVAADLMMGMAMSIDEYPLVAAVRDLDRYAFAGTIDGALAGLQESAAQNERSARRTMRELRRSLIADTRRAADTSPGDR